MSKKRLSEIDKEARRTEPTYFGKGPNGWNGEEETQKVMEAADRYNGEEGLSRLEAALGSTPIGDEASRIASIAVRVEKKVSEWEATKRSALLRDHELISRLFTLTEKVNVSAYVNQGCLPDTWWARLALALDKSGVFDRLTNQIHRESMAMMAKDVMQEDRSLGGKTKAANAKPNPERAQALQYASEHPGLSALQIKTRAKLRASERTIRGWLSAEC
jgi:hypothetical protein